MIKKENVDESFICLLGGVLLAIIFIALVLGDGNIGLIEFLSK